MREFWLIVSMVKGTGISDFAKPGDSNCLREKMTLFLASNNYYSRKEAEAAAEILSKEYIDRLFFVAKAIKAISSEINYNTSITKLIEASE